MGYGNTYSSETVPVTVRKSVPAKEPEISCVEKFCNKLGYHRESFENVELETKLNLLRKVPPIFSSKEDLDFGHELELPHPYCLDKILPVSSAIHDCYAFVDTNKKTLEAAFTEVDAAKRIKIKYKGKTDVYKKSGIYLLRRGEQHIPCDDRRQLVNAIANIVRTSLLPVECVGRFEKRTKECFMFNPISGRIFVMSTGLCQRAENEGDILDQLEIEYYGQINSYKSNMKVEEELITLTSEILDKMPNGYKATSTILTKLEWMASKSDSFKNFKVIGEQSNGWAKSFT